MALLVHISFDALPPFRVIGHLCSWAQRLSFHIPLCSRKAGMYGAKLFIESTIHAEEEQTITLKKGNDCSVLPLLTKLLGKGFCTIVFWAIQIYSFQSTGEDCRAYSSFSFSLYFKVYWMLIKLLLHYNLWYHF